MDKTLDFYNNNSQEYIKNTISVDMKHLYVDFLNNVQNGGHILDLGCGSGRDSKAFIEYGYNVTLIDGSKKLAEEASRIVGRPVIVSKFEDLVLNEEYDGIWACASLLHINRRNIVSIIKNISNNLKKNGVFYMSFKYDTSEYIDEKGRYFNCYTEESFREMISLVPEIKIKNIYKTRDSLGGRGYLEWLNVLLYKV